MSKETQKAIFVTILLSAWIYFFCTIVSKQIEQQKKESGKKTGIYHE